MVTAVFRGTLQAISPEKRSFSMTIDFAVQICTYHPLPNHLASARKSPMANSGRRRSPLFRFCHTAWALRTTTATAVKCVDNGDNVPLLRRNDRLATSTSTLSTTPTLRSESMVKLAYKYVHMSCLTILSDFGCDSLCSMA
jgi:hypothetical protein